MLTENSRSQPAQGARLALTLLLLINLFNYIDRQVLSAVEKIISDHLLPGDPRSAMKMGWLANAFLLTYMILSPVFGRLATKFSRWHLIAFGVALWSLASGATGLATTYTMLLLTRCFVGVGEAAYGPIAPTLIADLYPVKVRGKVMAWFYAAIPVGSALGYVLGGTVAKALSWRWAFYLVVPPGLLLALWAAFMKDKHRHQAKKEMRSRRELLDDLKQIVKIPSYIYNTIGMTFMTFAIGGIAFFMPRFIMERGGGDEATVNFYIGLITVVAGLSATLLGGVAGDWLAKKYSGAYFIVSAVGLGLGFPLFLGVLYSPFPHAWVFLFFAEFALFFNTGPSNTILANVTASKLRPTAFALNILIIHALGDAISPVIIGAIKDATGSLRFAFLIVSFTFLAGAIAWGMGTKYLEKDTVAEAAAT